MSAFRPTAQERARAKADELRSQRDAIQADFDAALALANELSERDAQDAAAFRDYLGRVVRAAWVAWAERQPAPKPSWLVPWEELDERDREADRLIGLAAARAVEALYQLALVGQSAPFDPEGIVVGQTFSTLSAMDWFFGNNERQWRAALQQLVALPVDTFVRPGREA